MRRKTLTGLLCLAILLAACSPAAQPAPDADSSGDAAEDASGQEGPEEDASPAEDDSPAAEESAASTWSVVDSGQDYCYSDTASIACPSEGESYFGQDAQYQGNAARYQDNGDGTITDQVTGLMWLQDPGDKTTYSEAAANADSFSFAGYDDWRLPSTKELYSLIDFRGQDASNADSNEGIVPFLDEDTFVFLYGDESGGARVIDSQWATSTIYTATVMDGRECFFGVNFADGRIKCYETESRTNSNGGFFALYVRGDSYGENDFVDNGDGTVTDAASGLTWQQDDAGQGLNWSAALNYCANLSLGGSNDWRLPNAKELQSIVDYSRSPDATNSPALDPIFGATSITNEGGQSDWGVYWTSTTHIKSSGGVDNAVYVVFGRGLGYMEEFGGWIDVHGAGAQRSESKIGDTSDYPTGNGPQGDAVRIENMVRCVTGGVDAQVMTGGELDPFAVDSGGSGASAGGDDAPAPPQDAIDACSGLSAGDACSIGPNAGACTDQGGTLACQPEDGGGNDGP